MKSVSIISVATLLSTGSFACELCQRGQSKFVKAVSSHGQGPDSNWDYIFVVGTALIVLLTLFYSVKYLLSPKEGGAEHIKSLVID